MNTKIIGIFVCTLVIATAVPAVGFLTKQPINKPNFVDIRTNINTLAKPNDFEITDIQSNTNFVPGEFIVKFKPTKQLVIYKQQNGLIHTGLTSVDLLNEKYQVTNIENLASTQNINPYFYNIYKFTVPEKTDIFTITTEYTQNPNVLYAEPNYRIPISLTPNDTSYPQQWSLHNTGQTGGTVDADIDAPEAWDIETGDSNIVIAIHDTGVDWDHPDLANNIWTNPGEDLNHNGVVDPSDFNGIDDDSNGFIDDLRGWDFVDTNDSVWPGEDGTIRDNNPMDFHGHGTHCSGIASAVTNNNLGIAGVCWTCSIMPVRAGYTTDVFGGWLDIDDAVAGILYAADNGADILSMSWGTYEQIQVLEDAINYAYSQGLVMVAAGGNEGVSFESYPTSYHNVIGVAATDHKDMKTSWSNYGSWVDVAAPGANILSTKFNDTYFIWSGTSMATPMVAGVVGLMLSHTPTLSQQEVHTILRSTTDGVLSDQYVGTGRVNAYNALQRTSAPIVELDSSLDDTHVSGEISIIGTATGSTFVNYDLYFGKGPYPSEWIELATSTTPITNDVLAHLDTTLLDEDETYAIKLVVKDTYDYLSIDQLVIIIDNEPEPPTGYEIQWCMPFGGARPHQVLPIGDIDEDGINEIIVGYYEANRAGQFNIMSYDDAEKTYIVEHTWVVPPAINPTARWPCGASIIDLDDDGDLEFCVSWVWSAANGVYAMDWDGTTLTQLDCYNGIGFDGVYSTYPCDYDDDGDVELLIVNAPFEGTGDKHLTALGWDNTHDVFIEEAFWTHIGHTDKECWGIYSGDTDNDGKTEVIVSLTCSSLTAGTWALNWNDETDEFDEEPVCTTYSDATPGGVVVGDLNGNGIPEIGVGSAYQPIAWLYEWNGDEYVQVWNQSYPGESEVFYPVEIGDSDNDEINEFLIGTNKVHIIQWDGLEYTEEATLTDSPVNVQSIHVGDCDNDGENEVNVFSQISGAGSHFIYQYVGLPKFEISVSGGLGATITIRNTGDMDATNIKWNVDFAASFILPKQKNGSIPSLVIGNEETIKIFIFGFGKPTIDVSVSCSEKATSNKIVNGFLLLFFLLGVK